MFTALLYCAAGGLLLLSYRKDRAKTKLALRKAWKSFENILPQLFSVLLLVGILLAVLAPETISQLLGADSGVLGLAIAAMVGSITLIPGFVAFPLAASLLKAGAGYTQITLFLTTLMMVGVVTLPMEIRYFGRKLAFRRNALALLFSVGMALLMGGMLAWLP